MRYAIERHRSVDRELEQYKRELEQHKVALPRGRTASRLSLESSSTARGTSLPSRAR
jgi:hypothetical protein